MAISIFIASADYRSHVRRKIRAYHVFIRAGASPKVCCSMVVAAKLVWDSFGSWLRNIRPGIPPSEFVVASALPGNASRFSSRLRKKNGSLAKFIADRQDKGNMRILVPDAPPIDLERRKRDGRARAKAILRSEGAVLRDFVDGRMPIYDVEPDDPQGYDPATGG